VFITDFLFNKFPIAQPGKLSWARATAVCNSTLSAIALKVLNLDKSILHSSAILPLAMEAARAELVPMAYRDIVCNTWKLDPPKALGDVTESVLAAVFVDANFDLEIAFKVIRHVMKDLLEALHPDTPKDPISEMLMYMAKEGCTRGRFR